MSNFDLKKILTAVMTAAVLLTACTAQASSWEAESTSTPAPLVQTIPTSEATEPPTATPPELPTPTPTATEIALDAETTAFVEANGKAWADYTSFNEEENVYVLRMAFSGEFSEEVRRIEGADGTLLGEALISMKMEYFDGTQVQAVWIPLIVAQSEKDCLQRGTNPYPCSLFSVQTMLDTYQNGNGGFHGWHAGDRIEFWLPGEGAPVHAGASDALAQAYRDVNAEAYARFLSDGEPELDLLVPLRILMPCMAEAQLDYCYPEVTVNQP